jgi:hypothetical protein
MRNALLVVALVALSACTYHAPNAPTPIMTATAGVPASVRLEVMPGTGPAGGTATISAVVSDAFAAKVAGASVAFAAATGTFDATPVMTNANGTAAVVLTAPAGGVQVTARVGALESSTLVSVQPAAAPPPPVTSGPVPVPSTPLASLSIALSATTGRPGQQTNLSASILNPSGTTTISWDFGDGGSFVGSSTTTGHVYSSLGTFAVTAVVRDQTGRSASASTTATIEAPPPVVVAPPADSAGLVVTIGCTVGARATVTACNLSATYNGGALSSGLITRVDWDWGDGVGQIVNSPLGAHVYANPGTYIIVPRVTATTVDGPKTILLAPTSIKVS